MLGDELLDLRDDLRGLPLARIIGLDEVLEKLGRGLSVPPPPSFVFDSRPAVDGVAAVIRTSTGPELVRDRGGLLEEDLVGNGTGEPSAPALAR